MERLVDRVNNSTLLEDRRDACRALKAMSRKYRVEVGAQGMDTLKQVSLTVVRGTKYKCLGNVYFLLYSEVFSDI